LDEYKIIISKTAQKKLNKLPDQISDLLIKAILSLAQNPRPQGHIKLKGRDAFRIRKGDYRIIYEVNDNILTITVIALGHRKDIYKT